MAGKFKAVAKTKNKVPLAYLKGAKNPKAREKEILRTRKKYLSGKMKKEDYEAVEKSRAKDRVGMKKGGSVPACVKKYAKSSGKSTSTLMKVYKRGQGAYFSSGSRPGQSSHSWGCGRVRSFATGKGKARQADKDLLRKKSKKVAGGALGKIARGCGAVDPKRRKRTKYF